MNLRFAIRYVLWLTVVVAVAIGLWLGRSREIAKLCQAIAPKNSTVFRHHH